MLSTPMRDCLGKLQRHLLKQRVAASVTAAELGTTRHKSGGQPACRHSGRYRTATAQTRDKGATPGSPGGQVGLWA